MKKNAIGCVVMKSNDYIICHKELKVPVFESMSRIGTLRIYRIIKWTNFTQKWDFHYFR